MRFILAAAVAFLAMSCTKDPFVVLTITDPYGEAGSATQLFIGDDIERLRLVSLAGNLSFPLDVTVVGKKVGETILWAEGEDVDGVPVARGIEKAIFRTDGAPSATLELSHLCLENSDCDDGLFCTGEATCVQGICERLSPPCLSSLACVTTYCTEGGDGTGACSVVVDHSVCPQGAYCDLSAGCAPGIACQSDAQCDDGFVCNGYERCLGFRCEAGPSPNLGDGDICTLDGCDDARVAQGEEAEFHLALASFDGFLCSQSDGNAGICVSTAGGCVESACGDGVIDVGRNEICDDGASNSDAWSSDPHCNADCTGPTSYCGDDVVDLGDETCDDGDRNEDENGCDESCQRNDSCGDGHVDWLFESCDDGADGISCNGCFDDCTPGCLCFPDSCDRGTWCNLGYCEDCGTVEHCGPTCATCSGGTPYCAGVADGCRCDANSCGTGNSCDLDTCRPCDTVERCGPRCDPCEGDTPVCGGLWRGCLASDCTGLPDMTPCEVVTSPTDLDFDVCSSGVCVSVGCLPQNGCVQRVAFTHELGDTDTHLCFDAAVEIACPTGTPCESTPFCGQDAQFGWDTTHTTVERFATSHAVNDNPVVSDEATGLMWQACSGGYRGPMCGAGAVDSRVWELAAIACDVSTWGGFLDWRLPSMHELITIYDGDSTSISHVPSMFPNTPDMEFWTSTLSDELLTSAVYINFVASTPMLNDAWITDSRTYRCVRNERAPVLGASPRYDRTIPVTDQPIVVDSITGLTWQGCSAGYDGPDCTGSTSSIGWQAALTYCAGLQWGGSDDWRLPNVVEMQSISPTDSVTFPGGSKGLHLTSSTVTNAQSGAWAVDVGGYGIYFNVKILGRAVRCVRGMP